MFLRGESDWKPYLQVATALNVWGNYWKLDLVEDQPHAFEDGRHLIAALVLTGRVDFIAAFPPMKSFCDPEYEYGSGMVDIFTEETSSRSYSLTTKIQLRSMVKKAGKVDEFAPFFDHVDRAKAIRENTRVWKLKTKVCDLVAAEMSSVAIEQAVAVQRQEALAFGITIPPFGVVFHQAILQATGISQINCFEKDTTLLEALVRRADPQLLQWAFSIALQHEKNNTSERDEDLDFIFLIRASTAIVKTREISVMEDFLVYCSGEKGPPKYRGSRSVLMADLLNAEGKSVHHLNGWYGRVGGGGILCDIFGQIYNIASIFLTEHQRQQSPDPKRAKAKIERMYSFARWFLNQPKTSQLLHSEETRAKCFALTETPVTTSSMIAAIGHTKCFGC